MIHRKLKALDLDLLSFAERLDFLVFQWSTVMFYTIIIIVAAVVVVAIVCLFVCLFQIINSLIFYLILQGCVSMYKKKITTFSSSRIMSMYFICTNYM